jgi:hypothetical protein
MLRCLAAVAVRAVLLAKVAQDIKAKVATVLHQELLREETQQEMATVAAAVLQMVHM